MTPAGFGLGKGLVSESQSPAMALEPAVDSLPWVPWTSAMDVLFTPTALAALKTLWPLLPASFLRAGNRH